MLIASSDFICNYFHIVVLSEFGIAFVAASKTASESPKADSDESFWPGLSTDFSPKEVLFVFLRKAP